MPRHVWGDIHRSVSPEDRQGGGWISRCRHAGTRGDQIEGIADHVRKHEGHQPSRAAGSRQTACLHAAEGLADEVEFTDICSGRRQGSADGDHAIECHAVTRILQECRTAPGDNHDREVVGPQGRHRLPHVTRRGDGRNRRQVDARGPRLADLHVAEAPPAARRHAHEATHRAPLGPGRREHCFHRGSHAGRRFATADDDDSAAEPRCHRERLPVEQEFPTRRGKPMRHERFRPHGGDRGLDEVRHLGADGGGHSSRTSGKFLGSNRDRSIPPRDSSSRSFTRISSRSSRRARSAGDSEDGASGLTRGTAG